MLPAMMGANRLFVLGEGGSHNLKIYQKIKPAILLQLGNLNLKYFFNESGRAAAYIRTCYLKSDFDVA